MSVSKQCGKYSTRSRPRALDTEVVAQVLKLEAWAYLRGEADDEGYVFRNREIVFCSVNSYLGLLKHCSAYN